MDFIIHSKEKPVELEMIILNLITNSGEAKSYAMEALCHAKQGKIKEAEASINLASERLALAHKSQTQLIQSEARGEKIESSILLIHAQDHLMNAITVKDLAAEMIHLYDLVLSLKK